MSQQDLSSIQALLGLILTWLPPIQSSQSTPALQEMDNTTKGEKEGQEKGQGTIDLSKGKENSQK